MSEVTTLIGDVRLSTGYRYGTRDSVGNTMDTVKIIDDPSGGYFGIYHTGDEVKLATSTDLANWAYVRTLDAAATQPTIRMLPTGAFLTAVEYNDQVGSGGLLRLRHYSDRSALTGGEFDRERTLHRSLSACNEGTPHIEAVRLGDDRGDVDHSDIDHSDIDHSEIDLGFHYQRRCDVDRQGFGTLRDFVDWRAEPDTELDKALIRAAAVDGHRVRGNIGGRDSFTLNGAQHTVYEVQYRKNDFASWRVYLQTDGGRIAALPIHTHGTAGHDSSTAFANPTVSVITAPSGRPALAVTLFIPFEGAAPGEAGELVYYRELPG
ncbi:MAG: hypothetical protein ABWZ02_05525 [Nakamurella sp.]